MYIFTIFTFRDSVAGIGLLSLSRRYNPSIVFPSICEDTVSVDLEESIVGISWFTVRFNTCFAANFPSDLLSPLNLCLSSYLHLM